MFELDIYMYAYDYRFQAVIFIAAISVKWRRLV